ncbi:hypothetical protein OIU78_020961 [Salix suchowensis]|nr:hypothetical protein OIU78_020961 [Salix suchowensis]
MSTAVQWNTGRQNLISGRCQLLRSVAVGGYGFDRPVLSGGSRKSNNRPVKSFSVSRRLLRPEATRSRFGGGEFFFAPGPRHFRWVDRRGGTIGSSLRDSWSSCITVNDGSLIASDIKIDFHIFVCG